MILNHQYPYLQVPLKMVLGRPKVPLLSMIPQCPPFHLFQLPRHDIQLLQTHIIPITVRKGLIPALTMVSTVQIHTPKPRLRNSPMFQPRRNPLAHILFTIGRTSNTNYYLCRLLQQSLHFLIITGLDDLMRLPRGRLFPLLSLYFLTLSIRLLPAFINRLSWQTCVHVGRNVIPFSSP